LCLWTDYQYVDTTKKCSISNQF